MEIYPAEGFDAPDQEPGQEVKMITGHLDWTYVQNIQRPVKVYSMVRHPLDQVISHFLHLYPGNGADLQRFEEFLQTHRAQNWQCQYLSGWRDLPEALTNSGEMLNDATENLRQMELCGITERFEDSLLLLSRRLNLKNTAYHNRNRAKDRQSIERLRKNYSDSILSLNKADIELYTRANKLLDEHLRDERFLFVSRLSHRWQQRKYRRNL